MEAPEVAAKKTVDVLAAAFEDALRGDERALEVLLTLLKSRYGSVILNRLRRHRGRSGTSTVEDVFQQSALDFLEQVRAGALSDLPEAERRDVAGYFQGLCDRRLENQKKARLDPLFHLGKELLPEHLEKDRRRDAKVPAPGDDRKTERLVRHYALLRQAIRWLGPSHRKILERYLAGVPYAEISAETGIKVSTLESLVTRAKQEIVRRILDESPTARLHHGLGKEPPRPEPFLPTTEEIRREVGDLPPDIRRAVSFVHLEDGDPEKLARSLGRGGLDKVRARLARGYETLSLRLGLPFPDSFCLFDHE